MPLYEYECSACGHHFEVIRKFSDPPEDKCPNCGGTVHKMQSAPAFQFKGTGWYVTDYAKSGQTESTADSKDGRKPEDTTGGADSKKDAAPETSGKSATSTASTTGTSASPGTPAASATRPSKSGD